MSKGKISYSEKRAELERVNEELEQYLMSNGLNWNLITIHAETTCYEPICWASVNWCGIGGTNPSTAVMFANCLAKASELAENFKYNGYEVIR